MADFQPRFVDLVRNYTSTQGTGAFVLGPAVNGFTGFGSALQTGDSFYYSAIGVDNPAEREVGRGTLQANGTIARAPLSGPPTNFSSGTKSIALIAAAEWFNAVQAGAGSQPVVAATRIALAGASSTQVPGLLTERGREGLFLFDGSNLSAAVSSDPRQGIYVAPASDQTGASGAWVRRYSGAVNVRWFGAAGNDITDDGPSFAAALNYLKSIAYGGFGYSSASPALFVPFGTYFLGSTTLDLFHTLIIEGESVGEAGGGATVLRWAANTTGIRVQRYNTSGASAVDGVTHQGGDASVISRLSLLGAYTGSEGEHHAIHLRARATIRDLSIRNFQGDGIRIVASTGGSPEGNANNCEISRVLVENCRNGLYAEGADTNAGMVNSLSAIGCRQWGVWDRSFLGNTYSACHTAANGVVANVTPTLVHLSGRLFYVKPGQASAASTNSPPGSATDNTYWGYARDGTANAGMSIPNWSSGMSVREGGAYCSDSLSASHVLTNCYSEMDQAPSRLSQNSLVLNGLHAAGVTGCGRITSRLGQAAAFPNLYCPGSVTADGSTHSFGPKSGAAADTGVYFESTNYINSINGRSWLGGVPQVDGYVLTYRGFGIDINGNGQWCRFKVNNTDIGTFQADGLHVTGLGVFSGALSASNLSGSSSGTNTGDQTITLTGDVTGSGGGSFAATVSAGAVSLSKMANLAANSLIGNNGGSAAAPSALSGAQVRSLLGLSAIATSGSGADLTASSVTYAKIQNASATDNLLGRSSAGAGAIEEITCSAAGRALIDDADAAAQRTTLGLAAIAASGSGADLGAGSVGYAKIQNVSGTSKLLGRASAGAGVIEELGLTGGLTISGTNLALGAITPTSVAASAGVTSSGATAGVGYAAGAGGTATQATSKSTGVTLNKVSGQITMNAASLAASTSVGFTMTNSAIAATDLIIVNIASGATADSYLATVDAVAAGSCRISLRNISAAAKSEAVVLNFVVVKAVNA
jgi:hypothetical protein